QDFTVSGERFSGYTPPPLHSVSVQNGQVQIASSAYWPNGSNNPPVLLGSALLMRGNAGFGSGFNNVLSQNQNVIEWAFNVANQDGSFNNEFNFILASTSADALSTAAQGYEITGGGLVGNRMVLSTFNEGADGPQNAVLDMANGLGTLPQMGSFMVTFNPATDQWKLFGTLGGAFVDPAQVSHLLGEGTDATYANTSLPYFGFGGGTTGLDIFDNVSVSMVPEPSVMALILAATAACTLLPGRIRSGKWSERRH
ncbi:MAG TPA: hypothetical protein VH251_00355, partial [Verrucomicrobiae bacterium]|nr:hypothetical protein [Verrucomicrobiae bacterium]